MFKRKGFSILEIVVAVGLLTGVIILYGVIMSEQEQAVLLDIQKHQANLLAREGTNAVRILQSQDWNAVPAGTYGLALAGTNWSLIASPDVSDIYTRTIQITNQDVDHKDVFSSVKWRDAKGREQQIILASRLVDWRKLTQVSSWLTVDTSQVTVAGQGQNEVRNIILQNIGITPLVITTMKWSWTNSHEIGCLRIDNNGSNQIVWDKNGPGLPRGEQDSGTTLDMLDVTIQPGDIATITQMKFDGKMSGTILNVDIGLGDGSTKTVAGIPI